LSGFSALRFLREARLDFLRSSLVNFDVFAMNAVCILFFFAFFFFSVSSSIVWCPGVCVSGFFFAPFLRETLTPASLGVTAESLP
jgi:hypothetical protein